MIDPQSGKDHTIIKALAQLKKELGESAFRVVDDREASAYAVGVASPKHEGLLANISAFDKPEGYYFLSLEFPPPPGSERSYAPAGEFEHVNLGRLVRLIKQHLRTERGRGWERERAAPETAPAKSGGKPGR
jgi:hypothetical protein